ncbi:MAG: carbonic anhydrase family protein [Gammaproteobacteria bacterium]|nr:carbonic anhydrase family protein [Gammaproteobacteria bacterium]
MKSDITVFKTIFALLISFSMISIASAGPKDFDRGDAALPSFITGGQSSSKPAKKETKKESKKASKKSKKKEAQVENHEFHKADWDYRDPSGWGSIKEDYHLCKNGTRQSPIDITSTKPARLSHISFNYRKGAKTIVNNGHTIQVDMHKGNYIVVSGKRYELLQFHFHTPSEHTVDGKPADMVAHFVHKASDGELAVVGVLFKACQENNTISQIWRRIPVKAGQKKKMSRKINVLNMLPKNRGYYMYSGSLTTPPCTEGVKWMVLKNTVPVSDAQVKTFADLIDNNARPVQEKYHRTVLTRN